MSEHKNRAAEKEPTSSGHKILTIVGIILCVILIPILIVNVTLLIKGYVNEEKVPSVGGYSPLIVLTDSMFPTISSGDLIVVKSVDPSTVKEGDVISFFDPDSNGTAVVTHRVLKQNVTAEDKLPSFFNPENEEGLVTKDGKLYFRTQGDANNTPDQVDVPAENLVGVWKGTKFPGLGSVALWLQSTTGLIVCIGVPIILLVLYDLLRRRRYDRAKRQDTDALLAELEALRAGKGADPKAEETAPVEKVEAASPVPAEETSAEGPPMKETSDEETPAEAIPEQQAPAETEETPNH